MFTPDEKDFAYYSEEIVQYSFASFLIAYKYLASKL
jgi:hypothetical protein